MILDDSSHPMNQIYHAHYSLLCTVISILTVTPNSFRRGLLHPINEISLLAISK